MNSSKAPSYNISGYSNQGYSNQGYQNRPAQSQISDVKKSKLVNLLKQCTYEQQHGYKVFEDVCMLLIAYPNLEPDILSYKQGNNLKCFVEVKGFLPINFHGDKMYVFLNMMFPEKYPISAPNIRIINTEPELFDVNPHYVNYQSKSDKKSYMLSKMLESTSTWKPTSNIINVVKDAEQLMMKWFPFKKLKPGEKPKSYINVPPQQSSVMRKNQSSTFSEYPSMDYDQGQNRVRTQGNVISKTVTNTQIKVSNIPQGNVNTNPLGIINKITNPDPVVLPKPITNPKPVQPVEKIKPVQLNQLQQIAKLQVQDFVSKNNEFISTTKQAVQNALLEHSNSFKANQGLSIIKKCLEFQTKFIQNGSISLNNLVRTDSQKVSFEDMVIPVNEWSKHLLEGICVQKAANDTLDYIKSLFEDGEITLQQLLKQVRKVEEERFLSSIVIKKKMENKL